MQLLCVSSNRCSISRFLALFDASCTRRTPRIYVRVRGKTVCSRHQRRRGCSLFSPRKQPAFFSSVVFHHTRHKRPGIIDRRTKRTSLSLNDRIHLSLCRDTKPHALVHLQLLGSFVLVPNLIITHTHTMRAALSSLLAAKRLEFFRRAPASLETVSSLLGSSGVRETDAPTAILRRTFTSLNDKTPYTLCFLRHGQVRRAWLWLGTKSLRPCPVRPRTAVFLCMHGLYMYICLTPSLLLNNITNDTNNNTVHLEP